MARKKINKKKDLAAAAGITPVTLSGILAGNGTSFPTAKKLAEMTGSDPLKWLEGDAAYMARITDDWMYGQDDEYEEAS